MTAGSEITIALPIFPSIRWRWPCIDKAGVLAAVPTDDSGTGAGPFRAEMKKHHGYQFGRGDVVAFDESPRLFAFARRARAP